MASQFSPIEVDLGPGIEKRSFSKLQEILDWFHAEKSKWAWVAEHDKTERGEINHALQSKWQEIGARINAISSTDPSHSGSLKSATDAFELEVRVVYAEGRLPYSESPRGRWLLELASKAPKDAVYALAWYIQPQVLGPLAPAFHRGVSAALMFETGFETRLDALVAEHSKAADEAHAAFLEQLVTAKKKFLEEMTFREPVKFWVERAQSHRHSVRIYGAIVATSFLIGAAAVVLVAQQFLNSASPQVWRIAAVGVVGTLAIWISRIFVRILLSHVHLASDAEERTVMMKAYLALVDEGKAMREEDRRYVLQALFRSAATGIVKDDSGPETVPDIVARVIKTEG